MKIEDAEEFTQSLGMMVAVSWRQIALAKRLGVPKALGLSTEQWVEKRLGGYVRMSIKDRRRVVKELAEEGMSKRAIGEVLGVDESTIRDTINAGNPAPSSLETASLLSSEREGAGNPASLTTIATLAADGSAAPKRGTAELIVQSNGVEWYTPSQYIESARLVLGDIDLDPASCEQANRVVKAKRFFTQEHNGLDQDWRGRVWLNPPYGKACSAFVSKLCQTYENGHVSSAILLVNSNSTDTDWFWPLWRQLLCFTNHRINFNSSKEVPSGSTHGSCFVYFGNEKGKFSEEFRKHGAVVYSYEYFI